MYAGPANDQKMTVTIIEFSTQLVEDSIMKEIKQKILKFEFEGIEIQINFSKTKLFLKKCYYIWRAEELLKADAKNIGKKIDFEKIITVEKTSRQVNIAGATIYVQHTTEITRSFLPS